MLLFYESTDVRSPVHPGEHPSEQRKHPGVDMVMRRRSEAVQVLLQILECHLETLEVSNVTGVTRSGSIESMLEALWQGIRDCKLASGDGAATGPGVGVDLDAGGAVWIVGAGNSSREGMTR